MKPADQRFAELLFDVSKPMPKKAEDLYARDKVVGKIQPSERWKGGEGDLPPVPEMGSIRTIQLVRAGMHRLRQKDQWPSREEDEALAVFDRALAALLERLMEDERRARMAGQ